MLFLDFSSPLNAIIPQYVMSKLPDLVTNRPHSVQWATTYPVSFPKAPAPLRAASQWPSTTVTGPLPTTADSTGKWWNIWWTGTTTLVDLNVKTKAEEIFVHFRKNQLHQVPGGADNGLSDWFHHTRDQLYMHFLQWIEGEHLPLPIFNTFYWGTRESILMCCIAASSGPCNASNWTMVSSPSPFLDIVKKTLPTRCHKIIKDISHRLHGLLRFWHQERDSAVCRAEHPDSTTARSLMPYDCVELSVKALEQGQQKGWEITNRYQTWESFLTLMEECRVQSLIHLNFNDWFRDERIRICFPTCLDFVPLIDNCKHACVHKKNIQYSFSLWRLQLMLEKLMDH